MFELRHHNLDFERMLYQVALAFVNMCRNDTRTNRVPIALVLESRETALWRVITGVPAGLGGKARVTFFASGGEGCVLRGAPFERGEAPPFASDGHPATGPPFRLAENGGAQLVIEVYSCQG